MNNLIFQLIVASQIILIILLLVFLLNAGALLKMIRDDVHEEPNLSQDNSWELVHQPVKDSKTTW